MTPSRLLRDAETRIALALSDLLNATDAHSIRCVRSTLERARQDIHAAAIGLGEPHRRASDHVGECHV